MRVLKYCSSWEAVNQEVKRVKQMLTNNGYPISMIDDITRKTISKHFSQTEDNDQSTSGTTHRLYFKNQMSPVYKADENALKTIIHRKCKPAQQNDKLELRIYYISPKTSSLMTNNRQETRLHCLKRTSCTSLNVTRRNAHSCLEARTSGRQWTHSTIAYRINQYRIQRSARTAHRGAPH